MEYQKLKLQMWPVDRLIPYARNARTHSDRQIGQIAASIAEFGFVNPVLVNPDGRIIAGHGRVLAARKLKLSDVPVIVLDHLNENQTRALMLADNRLALNSGWDEDMLRLELQALAEAGHNLESTGFDERELARLVVQVNQQTLTDIEEAPPLQDEPVTKSGDLWTLGEHRVLCGDSTQTNQLKRVLDGRSSDMIFTDPPYNAGYEGKTSSKLTIANDDLGEDFESFLQRSCMAMLEVNTGAIYICMSSGQLHHLYRVFGQAGGHWSTYIIWAKHTFTLGHSDYQRQFEPILYGWKAGSRHYWCGDRNQGDVWLINKPHANKEHPTMKPVELVERAIINSSRKGDLVLDPFGGSGTTLIAAERTGRRARVVEIDPRYADVIVRRWQNCTNESARLETGETFAEIEEQRRTSQSPEEEHAA